MPITISCTPAIPAWLISFVHRDDEALATFEREALLPDVLGVQEALKAFGRRQALQHVLLLLGVELRVGARALELLLPPALLRLVGHVHVLGTDGAAIGFAQGIQQVAQRHGLLAEERVAGVEHRFEIGIGEAVEGRLEFGDRRALGTLERVEVGPAGPDVAVGGNQLLDRSALAAELGVGAAGLNHARGSLLGAFGEGIDDRKVGNVPRVAAVGRRNVLQRVEISAPVVGTLPGLAR